jgi:hypothetical protein
MTLDCNHDCVGCPAHLLYGGSPTSCLIMNKVLLKIDCDIRISKQLLKNAEKEGDKK